jgi:hypothetical protein
LFSKNKIWSFVLGWLLKKKHAQKARKMSNIIEGQVVPNKIEEQTIVVYVASPFQGIS